MRNILVIGLAVAALAFVGCGDDDDENGTGGTGGSLVGAGGDGGRDNTPGPGDEFEFPENPCTEPMSEECTQCTQALSECGEICTDESEAINAACDGASADMDGCKAAVTTALECWETTCPEGYACSGLAAYKAILDAIDG